jgi:hypothetical protein
VVSFTPQFLHSWGNNPGTHWIEGWKDPRDDVKSFGKPNKLYLKRIESRVYGLARSLVTILTELSQLFFIFEGLCIGIINISAFFSSSSYSWPRHLSKEKPHQSLLRRKSFRTPFFVLVFQFSSIFMLVTECCFENCLFWRVQFISTLHSRSIFVSAHYKTRFSEHPPSYCLV